MESMLNFQSLYLYVVYLSIVWHIWWVWCCYSHLSFDNSGGSGKCFFMMGVLVLLGNVASKLDKKGVCKSCDIKETSVTTTCSPSLVPMQHLPCSLGHSWVENRRRRLGSRQFFSPLSGLSRCVKRIYSLIWKINEPACATLLLWSHH